MKKQFLAPPSMDKYIFIEPMNIATTSIDFSFNNKMYKQIDGVPVGSPLGPNLATIFVRYYKEKLFIDSNQPLIYFRYANDTFAMFEDESNRNQFSKKINSLHRFLTFTHKKKVYGKLPFLDVLIEKSNSKFLSSVYRKSSFSYQYNRWNSFGSKSKNKQPHRCPCTPSFVSLFAYKITPRNRFHSIDFLLLWLSGIF